MVTAMHGGFLKDDLDQEDFCDNGGGIQSIHREDIDELDDFFDESLDGDDRNKDSISVLQESNFDMVFLRFKHGMVLALKERITFSRMAGHAIKIYNLTLLVPWEDNAFAQKAAEILAKEGISAEVINLRSIRPLDRATMNASIWKTSTLVVTVEEGFPQHGVFAKIWCSGKVFTAKGMQVLELVGKKTMDLLSTETGIEVDKKKAQAQDDEDEFSSSEIEGSATTSEKGKKIETGVEGSADEMKHLHDSSVKKAAEMAVG
ncbi:hypothetical protein LOK49_Contig123G00006 [Camellia lanceoleosa]|nr:hypothetical protein LOK49_Contig123G00006 [Camellia lanceoleosa]